MIPLRDSARPRRGAVINPILILVNVIVFLYEVSLNQRELMVFILRWGVIPARVSDLGALLGDVLGGDWAAPATLVTATFLHGGWMHLLGNMLYLWVFGDNIEDRLGRARYVLFYLGTGVLANYAQVLADPDSTVPLIGASGAVAAVLGAYLVSFPRSRVVALVPLGIFLTVTEVPALVFLFLWFVIQLLSGVASLGVPDVGGVAWWAHVGGFVLGMILIRLLRRRPSYTW